VKLTSPVGALDRLALSRLSRRHGAPARFAAAVSAVTHGGIGWHVASLALIATRRRPAVRVAIAGSGAWTLASLLAAVIKRLTRRRRPTASVGPAARTSSMPSSHTATAVAYATGAALQHPAASLFSVPACVVAWSRLKTRRHFPTDVVAGIGLGLVLGAVAGIAVRRVAATSNEPSGARMPAADWVTT
jgi:membrane-associated phospholipid phosphatase